MGINQLEIKLVNKFDGFCGEKKKMNFVFQEDNSWIS